MHIASIASFLPTNNDKSSIYGGVAKESDAAQEHKDDHVRSREAERQLHEEDAKARVIVWSADEKASAIRRLTSIDDAKGEADPTFALSTLPPELPGARQPDELEFPASYMVMPLIPSIDD